MIETGIARQLADNPEIRQIIMLCKNGIPFDVAVSFEPDERFGWFVACAELEGARFDWDRMAWRERD